MLKFQVILLVTESEIRLLNAEVSNKLLNVSNQGWIPGLGSTRDRNIGPLSVCSRRDCGKGPYADA
jgi:hypothetical protein